MRGNNKGVSAKAVTTTHHGKNRTARMIGQSTSRTGGQPERANCVRALADTVSAVSRVSGVCVWVACVGRHTVCARPMQAQKPVKSALQLKAQQRILH